MRHASKLAAIALLAGVPWCTGTAAAAPLGQMMMHNGVAAQTDIAAPVQQVQFRRWGGWRGGWGGWRGRGGWWGPGAVAAGVLGGLALTAPWYGSGYYNNYGPGYGYYNNPGY